LFPEPVPPKGEGWGTRWGTFSVPAKEHTGREQAQGTSSTGRAEIMMDPVDEKISKAAKVIHEIFQKNSWTWVSTTHGHVFYYPTEADIALTLRKLTDDVVDKGKGYSCASGRLHVFKYDEDDIGIMVEVS
jgi:hypothetical protein